MIKKVIQCADVHIRNYQRLEEYSQQLDKFVEKCKEIAEPYDPDEVRIVICGDICHSKTSISNELIVYVSNFIRELEKICKVLVISGNHDLLVNNQSRVDTISAIFQAAQFKNAVFLDNALEYQSGVLNDDNVSWALYSIFDNFNRPNIEEVKEMFDKKHKIIGLYHGTIVGAELNNGTTMQEGMDLDTFKGCDCVMAGDIHKRQVLKRGKVEVVYSGSLIQQTFGETVSQHGFVVWDIPSLKHEFVDLESDYGLFDIELKSLEDIDSDKEVLRNA